MGVGVAVVFESIGGVCLLLGGSVLVFLYVMRCAVRICIDKTKTQLCDRPLVDTKESAYSEEEI